jgi:S-DNA-T family DNA segregation ATPase FtsK/SpoIIIE
MAQFNRPPRLLSPLPSQVVNLPKIPATSDKKDGAEWLTVVLPFVATILSVILLLAISGGNSSWTSYLIFIPVMLVSYLASMLVSAQQKKENKRKLAKAHAKLKNEIYNTEKTLADLKKEEQKKRLLKDPDINECLNRAQKADPRLGERRPDDDDFLSIRVGTGKIPATYQIHQQDQNEESEEFSSEIGIIKNLVDTFTWINEAPFLIQLPKVGSLGICGSKDDVRFVVNSLICQMVTHHWVDEVRVAVICSSQAQSNWQWVSKSPHSSTLMSALAASTDLKDPRKAINSAMKELELELLQREQTYEAKKLLKRDDAVQFVIPMPRLVIIFEDMESAYHHPAVSLMLEKGKELGVYGIFLTDHPSSVPGNCGGVISYNGDKLYYKESGINTLECKADQTDQNTAEHISEALAAIRFPTGGITSQPPERITFLQMFNARRVEEMPVEEFWSGKSPYGYLRAPIGKTSPTSDWIFDLNDRDGAHGPHGLLGGMTGSGKSEVLKTILLALAVTHHPYDLNFALIDFKGGAAFNELRNLPHTVGVVTDIESNATYAERVIQSLTGEIERRKKVLENARGTFHFGRSHIDEYREKMRTRRPLPRLLIVFDEFAEFKARNPIESRKLIGIARQGRSLGVHLLLATQNIAAAIDPEILQNSTYRICLRVSDPQDSIQMVGIPDAISLKRGRAYFSVSSRVLYQSAFSGADYDPDNAFSSAPNSFVRIYPDGHRDMVNLMMWNNPDQNKVAPTPATEAAAVVEYLAETARRMGLKKPSSVWQDPLEERIYLSDIQDKYISGGWNGKTWLTCRYQKVQGGEISMVFPYLGLYDCPENQQQPCFQIDAAQGGNILVFGSSGSGKSTLLRTFITSLALNHTPAQVHVYILDYGGQSRFKMMEAFPQIGAVITRLETERTDRLLNYLAAEMQRRSVLLRRARVDDWTDYNAQMTTADRIPAIFLIVDNFLNLKNAIENETIKKIGLLMGGQSAGIYLAISTYTQSDLPNEILSNISTIISFYQANQNEYHGLVGILSEAQLQEDVSQGMRPGRGFIRGTTPFAFQAALPTYGNNDKEVAENLSVLSIAMRNAWSGRRTPPEVRALDEFIYVPPVVQEKVSGSYWVDMGLSYQDLKPIGFDIGQDGNAFLVSSTVPGCGKTTYLQTWTLLLAENFTPDQVEIKVISFHSRSLSAVKELPHVNMIKNKLAFQDFLNELDQVIKTRKAVLENNIEADIDDFDSTSFLFHQSRIVIIIDDYGRFSSEIDDNQRIQLMDILQQGDELGISLIISDTMADLPKVYQDNLMGKFSTSGCGILLGGTDGIDFFNNARIMSGMPSTDLPIGRGYFIRRGKVSLFQAGVWWQQNMNPIEAFQNRIIAFRKREE